MPEDSTPSATIPTKQVFVTPDEIGSINTVLLTNAEHYEFINDVLMRLETETAFIANPAVKAAKERFANAHKEENRCLILSKRSELTEDIKTADAERDKLYVSYRLAVRSALSHPEADKAKAAKRLAGHLKDFSSLKPAMQLEGETGLLLNFIEDCEGKYATEVEALGLKKHIAALKVANNKVLNWTHERTDSSAKVLGELRTARRESDAAYIWLVKVVNAVSYIGTTPAVDPVPFIDYINKLIRRYKDRVLAPKKPAGDEKPKEPKQPKEPKEPKKPKDPKTPEQPKDPKKPDKPEPPKPPKEGDDGDPDIHLPEE